MCGRYVLTQAAKFERALQLARVSWSFEVSYNVAPTQSVPVVRLSRDGAEVAREGVMLRWGLIPFFAKGVPPKYSTINATIEKIDSGAVWRGPWGRGQRCILPAAGFYEWHLNEAGQKQPFFIHLVDHEVIGFAGLWDRSVGADGTPIESCAIITMPGNDLMRQVHNAGNNPFRMPAILAQADYDAWLKGGAAEARAVLRQYPPDLMVAYQVGTRVNSPRNNDEKLIDPVTDAR
jgi:putative SOS response-associated peptidase YedK